ncbi:hypothetical protein FSP39_020297 [Pinctada imbricata]|uniref:DUF6589 domain-containing protein n=1 Tax=Pinctada imbricata TaxID=66713 RepID=A0AA89C754_PINIB|nr:hypothetical protein FSP39_020297 [Pinctada imbricata]
MWRGIGEMARSDAIKENDGTRMIIHWKCDMPEFYEMNHTKYFIFAFRLLTAVNGGSSPRLARQVTWNRTVNVSGGVGKNIEMDLHMEHMNRDYKESIKSAGGQLTQQTIERHSQMVGVGRLFDKEFDKNVSCRKTGHRKAGGANRETDLYHLVRALLSNNCVEEVNEARQHTGFPHFILNNDISNPLAFKKRIFKHKKKIAKRMNIVGH